MPAQTVIRLRAGTALQWGSVNPVLAANECGVETDTKKIKIGDGATAWTSLGYVIDAVFTSALLSKVNGIQSGAQVNPQQASSGEVSALTETAVRLLSPAQVKDAVVSAAALSGVRTTKANLAAAAGIANQVVYLIGYTSAYDGAEGFFVWDAASTVADDGGTVIGVSGVSTGRWKRLSPTSEVNVKWFGVKGDGSTPDAVPLSTVLSNFRSVYIPHGVYACEYPLNISGDLNVRCDGELKLTATHAAGGFILVKADDSNVLWDGGIFDMNAQVGMNGICIGENVSTTNVASNIRFNNIIVKNSRIDATQEGSGGLYAGGGKGVTVQFHTSGVQLSNVITDDCDIGLSIEGSDTGTRYVNDITIDNIIIKNAARAGLFLAGARPSSTSSVDNWGYGDTKYGRAVLRGVIIDRPNTSLHADGGAVVSNYANFIDLEAMIVSDAASGIDLIKGNMTHCKMAVIAVVDNIADAIDVTPFTGASLATSTSTSLDISVDVRIKTSASGVMLRADTTKTQRGNFSVNYHSSASFSAASAGLSAYNHLRYYFHDVRQGRWIKSTSLMSTSPSLPTSGTERLDLGSGILTLVPRAAAPTLNLVAGIIAASDGTGSGFDGSSGAGLYYYTGSAWVPLFT